MRRMRESSAAGAPPAVARGLAAARDLVARDRIVRDPDVRVLDVRLPVMRPRLGVVAMVRLFVSGSP
jgi:hypothetical protein